MRYLTLGEVLDLYYRIMRETGGAAGLRAHTQVRS
jgi:hypothetical protein